MPRVKLGENLERKKEMKAIIRIYMAKHEVCYMELGNKMGVCSRTASKLAQNPDLCTMEQIALLMKVLKIPAEDMEVFVPWSRAS